MRNSLMRIAQMVLPGASAYERKSQRLDAAALGGQAECLPFAGELPDLSLYNVVHVYGPRELPPALFVGFPRPYVASGTVHKPRFSFRTPREPEYALAPVETDEFTLLPEAVEDAWFAPRPAPRSAPLAPRAPRLFTIASIARPSVKNIIEQTLARIRRFRDDIEWQLFTHQPEPEELANVGAWVDPAIDDHDFDGFTAEALVAGLAVVAARTPVNVQRCESGRTALLVPLRDPNELVHAILAALFKPEVAEPKISAARQTASKFRIRQRIRVLLHIYENVTS